ncbi:Alginate lyase [Sedimentisphaera salicampi]|uniref:Alginate lyase n=2 Tax=Sedimentisphaera salicampi TaxID=1941349 RepID=A0A1W6LJW0_9BACT|nr:Alginate lyase [Sedimentisphaera salicampi]
MKILPRKWDFSLCAGFGLNSALALFTMLVLCGSSFAHQIWFNSKMEYSDSRPQMSPQSEANFSGADFDAGNIGGSGNNSSGGTDNGTANDSFTYVANNQPIQGQAFTTASSAHGYRLNSITVQMAGYSNNVAEDGDQVFWDLREKNGPIILTIARIEGSSRKVITSQLFKAGGLDNPGNGQSSNGPGTYITFHLPFTTILQPNAVYGFEIAIGNGSSNFFEWLGTKSDSYQSGRAYHHSGNEVTFLDGDHTFAADMTALSFPPTGFEHPSALHSKEELNLMKEKVDAEEQPWLSGWNMLLSSPYNNFGWPAYNVDYISRGGASDNYTRCQQDAHLIYTQALRWHITGDTAYADRAVHIANVWSDLIGLQGNSNRSLAAGICGFLFAASGDLLSSYPGWEDEDKKAYKDMMMRVFYPENLDFLWRHHDTFWREGGNTHYRLNWDTANMASMAAIGVLCDNRAVYEQALDFFKYGPGNGRVERAAWYIHPNGLGQGEEAGRDQGHNLGGWYFMAMLCKIAWNQGDDLFGYDNNRVLRAFEYNAKYNLGHNVPYTRHQNCDMGYTEGSVSSAGRGLGGYYQYELVYNHYEKQKGIAAPWSKRAAEQLRPEPWPDTGLHPSQVDWFGLGTLTFTKEPQASETPPAGLRANWSNNEITLHWWGSAGSESYIIKRSETPDSGFNELGRVNPPDLYFKDTSVENGKTYYYIVEAVRSSENLQSEPLRVSQELAAHYTFEGDVKDLAGSKDAKLCGAEDGLPGFTSGVNSSKAIDLNGKNQYVKLPAGAGNYQDITVSAWVYWRGGGDWQRVFDFGSEIEKSIFLTVSGNGGVQFGLTTTKWGNYEGDACYYLRGPEMPVNKWTHLAVSLKGDTATLYVNAEPEDQKQVSLVDPLFAQPYCYIGKSMWNSDPCFNGKIDDFRIYNYGLSQEQIENLPGEDERMQVLRSLAHWWLFVCPAGEDEKGCLAIDFDSSGAIDYKDFCIFAYMWS